MSIAYANAAVRNADVLLAPDWWAGSGWRSFQTSQLIRALSLLADRHAHCNRHDYKPVLNRLDGTTHYHYAQAL